MNMMTGVPPWERLIRPDRVHGSLYTDPEIFEAELKSIWYRTWVYVGHGARCRTPTTASSSRSARNR